MCVKEEGLPFDEKLPSVLVRCLRIAERLDKKYQYEIDYYYFRQELQLLKKKLESLVSDIDLFVNYKN